MIQKETGHSSWFGFSFVIRKESKLNRKAITQALNESQIDCRPIVAGNFAKNKVVQLMEHEIHGDLKNSNWIGHPRIFCGQSSI
jgi:CDP-6-deoxy-D-xylo-4-hexulose-3-dehydrase